MATGRIRSSAFPGTEGLARTAGRSDAELSADRAGEAVIDLAMARDGRAFPGRPHPAGVISTLVELAGAFRPQVLLEFATLTKR
jgi:hypothetical protein